MAGAEFFQNNEGEVYRPPKISPGAQNLAEGMKDHFVNRGLYLFDSFFADLRAILSHGNKELLSGLSIDVFVDLTSEG
jgi:hypothetical protein